jgi:signal transduction histidine kinase
MVLIGNDITNIEVQLPCGLMAVALSILEVEFLLSFPERPAPSPRVHLALLAWGGFGILCVIYPGWPINNVFFLPTSLAVIVQCVLGLKRDGARTGVRLILGALILRWAMAVTTYSVGPFTAIFRELLWFESTIAVMLSYLLIGHAMLRDQMFRVRAAVVETIVDASGGLLVLAATVVAIEAALAFAPGAGARRVALVGAALVPLLLTSLLRRWRPRLEKGVLGGLDERRALRLDVLAARGPAGDLEATIADARARIGRMKGDGTVAILRGDAVPKALAEHLAADRDGHVRASDPGLPFGVAGDILALDADLIVAIRSGHRVLGALALTGGTIDRDTLVVTQSLAGQLALALDNHRLFGELEETRRLAALGQFAAAIAHDIRTPLTAIKLNVQILRGKVALPADDMEYFDIALDELARLDRSVSEILDYAKPVRLAPAAVDVRELVDDAARGLGPVLAGRALGLDTEHLIPLPPVHGDPQRLRQVLMNLVDNAAGASTPGARIAIRTRTEGDRVIIDVEDSGRGIAAGDLDKIFDPFFTTRPDGTGLGLAICQKLVRAHGGELRVRSTLGKGATFSVVLPAPVTI